jgi:hypothetical protein
MPKISKTLPHEIEYLRQYNQARQRVEVFVEMPDTIFDLMMGFLRQNKGHFSNRARTKDFQKLTDEEAASIESIYQDLLLPLDTASVTGRNAAGQ